MAAGSDAEGEDVGFPRLDKKKRTMMEATSGSESRRDFSSICNRSVSYVSFGSMLISLVAIATAAGYLRTSLCVEERA